MSLTTQDKQDIRSIADEAAKVGTAHLPTKTVVKQMIKEGIETSPVIQTIISDIKSMDSKLDVLFEDLESKISTVIEIVTDNSNTKDNVINHEYRLTNIENVQPMIIKTLKMHSKQLQG